MKNLLGRYMEDTANNGPFQLPLISSPEVTNSFRMFGDLAEDLKRSHDRFHSQALFLAENSFITSRLVLDNSTVVPNFNTLSSGKWKGFAASVKAGALRDMRTLPDGPQKLLIQYSLDIIGSLGIPGQHLAEERDVSAMPDTARRQIQLRADAFFMLENEAGYRTQRAAARGRGEANVDADPAVDELRRRILDKAGGDAADDEYVGYIFTDVAIAFILLANTNSEDM